MPIDVTIIKSPDNVNLNQASLSFAESGGTIGRGPDNTWVLDDPEKYMSSCHAQISFENGQYMLTDLSTNGTFVNGSGEALGNGAKVALNEGDRFTISDYEFAVNIRSDAPVDAPFGSGPFADNPLPDPTISGASPMPLNNDPFDNDPFAAPPIPASHVSGSDPFANNPFPANPNTPNNGNMNDVIPGIHGGETDPLAALDKANGMNNPGNNLFNQPANYIPEDPSIIRSPNPNDPIPYMGGNQQPFNMPGSNPAPQNDPFAGSTMADNPEPGNMAINWPKSVPEDPGKIPEDWDFDEVSPAPAPTPAPVKNQPAAQPPPPQPTPPQPQPDFATIEALSRLENDYLMLENENKELMTEIARLKHYIENNKTAAQQPAPAPAATSRAYGVEDQTLVEGMGLSEWNLDQEKSKQISATAGVLIRESLEGIMRVLSFRKKIKEEFRINVTTIQPVENNPLKFSANIDDAMENMFIKDNKAYMDPVEAVREGFQGIAEHQVAVLAGMQAAFRGMLERFDPLTLEKRFEKYNKSGLIQFGSKGRNWESYKNYHQGLVNDVENSFQHLFGYDFVQAYEDQLQRLLIARKASKKSKV